MRQAEYRTNGIMRYYLAAGCWCFTFELGIEDLVRVGSAVTHHMKVLYYSGDKSKLVDCKHRHKTT